MTTSNKLDSTTSSILLAKRLAFASALTSPVNLSDPEQSKANYTARPNEQESGAWQRSAILGTEKIRQDRNGQGTIQRIRPRRGTAPDPASQNFGGVPHPPVLLS